MALSADGRTLYVSQNGPETYRQQGQGRVLEFGTAQRAFTTGVQVAASQLGQPVLRPHSHDLYVSGDNSVLHLNTAGTTPTVVGTVQGVPATGYYDLAFTPDGGKIFALSGGVTTTAGVIDPATDTVTGTFTVTSANAVLSDLQVSPDGSTLFMLDNNYTTAGSVLAFDTTTGAAVPGDTVTSGETELYGLAVGPGNDTLYLGGTSGQTAVLQIANY
ncbi:YncE family protein [Kitasatospora sp. NPDC052896]|uniref:YncE family protein n=1 Tax=Kitasatospora sp. NPDC052896 TaxID=3364061 RepID=UPI0037C8C1E0